jgi:nitrite reductase/ring-hydroxylating ferredoxin subunit
MTASAWLGGELVYRRRVGVNHAQIKAEPTEWTPVMSAEDLEAEGVPQRVEVDGYPLLLYRYEGELHAIDAVCAHAGGPLDEGSFDGPCVTCPWHQSVYDIRNGHVVHGPSTYSQPYYETRIQDGEVYVRAVTSS